MMKLNSLLMPIKVRLNQLLLDPNNPRFSDFEDDAELVPEARYAEEKVQERTFDRMKQFDVAELRDTIVTVGFLPLDRVVVREWDAQQNDSPKYVVVEGNRRVTALKWLMVLQEEGKRTLSEESLSNYREIEVLLLDKNNAPMASRLVLPGLRHVSGIKEWGPYQKARAVSELKKSGAQPQDIAQSLGLSTRSATALGRSYLAFEQMRADEEYGELIMPRKFSYFEEVFKRPNVREWLGWSDDLTRFTNDSHLREFYAWMIGEPNPDDEEEGERAPPKLPEAKSVRQLSQIIDDESSLAIFRGPNGTLTRALSRLEAEKQYDWQTAIGSAESTLATLSPDTLRSMKDDDISLLNNLYERVQKVLKDRSKLLTEG